MDDIGESRSYWRGIAEGGPLDGSEISVEAAPNIPMRALHVVTFVGDASDDRAWHLYALSGQHMNEDGEVVGRFTHHPNVSSYPPEDWAELEK